MKEFERAHQIVNLIVAEKKRHLSEEEQSLLNEWICAEESNKRLYESLISEGNSQNKSKLLSEFKEKDAYDKFVELTKVSMVRSRLWQILKYAAVLIPLIVASYFFYQQTNNTEAESQLTNIDFQPGTSKAVLVLEDGHIVNLEEEEDFDFVSEDIDIINDNSAIEYRASNNRISKPKLRYNILKVPRGGEYQLSLSDGTKVWLNSETEIKFPVIFCNMKREIFLKGEAYFEVEEDKECPFIVNTSSISLKVLGTSFNVRAYGDENQTTSTLVSGKVLLRELETQKEIALVPNEQAVTASKETVVRTVDVDPYIAWMEGRILFEENTIEEIFNDLSRWYNFEIEYASQDARNLRYSIDVMKYESLSEVLNILELTERIKFEINENKLLIMNNQ